MAVMSRCRSENLQITVQDIITSKSISKLAALVKLPVEILYEEENDRQFDLSPIQQLYFQCTRGVQTRFNQSVTLEIPDTIKPGDIELAVCELVKAHSMLRARFSRDSHGIWRQRITKDINGSYRFQWHGSATEDLQSFIKESQSCVDIINGPVFVVSLFEVEPKRKRLFIAAHHLIVDVVSWTIILEDLEKLLRSLKTLQSPTSLSFQTWCHLQKVNAHKNDEKAVLVTEDIPAADIDFWGMQGMPNDYGGTQSEYFQLEEGTTSILKAVCHGSMQNELLNIMLAALLISFGRVFSDRQVIPAIYNEGHGREPWESTLDLSRTIGWFTTLTPIHLPRGCDIAEGRSSFHV